MSSLCDVRWMVSSMDNELHYSKELFHDSDAIRSILGANAPYAVPKQQLVIAAAVAANSKSSRPLSPSLVYSCSSLVASPLYQTNITDIETDSHRLRCPLVSDLASQFCFSTQSPDFRRPPTSPSLPLPTTGVSSPATTIFNHDWAPLNQFEVNWGLPICRHQRSYELFVPHRPPLIVFRPPATSICSRFFTQLALLRSVLGILISSVLLEDIGSLLVTILDYFVTEALVLVPPSVLICLIRIVCPIIMVDDVSGGGGG
ncbi:hypothetical protein Vadar_004239 [Vaccinium darrowii]|uniref:Uncharacterized protein n=1 Tax=Vaccinium darrowii TaxID=229202 RepID=A0ACB7WXN1_9ERIC|nr:hypothetical protein Vadar_004239 [Vaccinium darrowii]